MRGRPAVTKHQRYLGPDPFWVLYDIVRPEAQDAPALAFHCCRATLISLDLEGMMLTIDLDDELS